MTAPRRLGALDLDRAAAIHRDAFAALGERGWTRQELAELLASSNVAGWLMGDVGLALCRRAADEVELLTLAVLPAHRRAGHGRELLQAAIAWAKGEDARALFLEVGADNPPARALYESFGFQVIGGRKAYYRRVDGVSADAVVMRLALS
ncbi:MAG TPA: GNAT family N-acetyltransferase [Reyranellaceae bacterium]|nr:GNAT family N-acetyltransferase [Reyranellaceae bacterium]